MSLATVIEAFCSQDNDAWEQPGILRTSTDSRCSHHSQRSQRNENNRQETIVMFLEKCCLGLSVTPDMVISDFLSVDDQLNILDNYYTVNTMRSIIKCWINIGTPCQTI